MYLSICLNYSNFGYLSLIKIQTKNWLIGRQSAITMQQVSAVLNRNRISQSKPLPQDILGLTLEQIKTKITTNLLHKSHYAIQEFLVDQNKRNFDN